MYRNFIAFLCWTIVTAFESKTNYTEEVHFLNKYIVKVKSKKNEVKIVLKDVNGNKISIGTWARKAKCIVDAKNAVLSTIIDSIEFDETEGKGEDAIA